MGKKNRRKREKKRKAGRPNRRGRQVSLAYHGNRYKTEALVKVHMHAEIGILESFVMADRQLTDRVVASALQKLILRMRSGPLPDLEDTLTFSHARGEEEDLVVWSILRNWQLLFKTEPRPNRDNLIGVLRTILGSLELRKSADPMSRNYLRFIEGFLGELGISVEVCSQDSRPIEPPEEADLLLIGRVWCQEHDPEAASEFRARTEYLLRSGRAEQVVEVCQQLIEEAPSFEVVPELSALSARAQRSLQASMG